MIDKKKIEKSLNTLNDNQLSQLRVILLIKTMPLFSENFLKSASESGYLNILFLTMTYYLVILDMKNLSSCEEVKIQNGKYLANIDDFIALARNISLHNVCDFDSSDYALDKLRNLILIRDANRIHDCILPSARPRARAHDRVLALELISFFDEMSFNSGEYSWCHEIELIRNGQIDRMNNNINMYGGKWERWNSTLCEIGGEYWADWYKRLLDNHYMIGDINEVKQILEMPKGMLEREISVSAKHLKAIFEQGARRLNEARVIILGEKGSGKTSLARRLVDPLAPMPEKDESTEGVDISGLKLSDMSKSIIKDNDANVHIWDFAGHSVTHASHRFFLSEHCLYIILCDGRIESSHNLGYWLDHVSNYGGNSKVLVLINLIDGHTPDIAENYYQERYGQHQCEFFKFSIRDDNNKLKNFRRRISEIIAHSPAWNQEVSLSYFKVKEMIQEEFSNSQNHISQKQFNKVAEEIPEADRLDLLKALDCLGTCLWYPEIEGLDYLVLNPRWITFGIYKIINWIKESKRNNALVRLSEFAEIFKDNIKKYDSDAQKFLYELMQYYELAYKRLYYDGIVVPQCLPIDSPKKEELPNFPEESSLYIEISAFKSGSEQPRLSFPPDVMPRFIVRRSEDIRKQRIWRFGAVLKKGNVTALIQQEHHLIRLQVKGKEKKAFYDELLITLIDVLREYKSFIEDKPEISCALITLGKTGYEMVPLYQVKNIVQKMEKDNTEALDDEIRGVCYSLENATQYLVEADSIKMYINCNFEGDTDMKDQINKSITTVNGDRNTTSTVQSNKNSDIDFNELEGLLEALMKEVPAGTSDETKKQVEEVTEAIENELKKEKPGKFTIKTLLSGLNGLVRTAEFGAAIVAIAQFVDKII